MTSSSSSDSVIPGSSFVRPTPNIHELNDLVRDRNFHPFLDRAFQPGYVATSDLRHFASLSNVIRETELSLDQYRFEQEAAFSYLLDSRRYQQQIRPVFRYYRTTYPSRARHHPYNQPGRPSRTSSSNSAREVTTLTMDVPIPASPFITPDDANALLHPLPPPSPITASSSPNRSPNSSSSSLGIQENPIIIEDDDDFDCTRCYQNGHRREQCDTPLRPATPCPVCTWTRQQTCDHYWVTPAWIRQQQRIIERR